MVTATYESIENNALHLPLDDRSKLASRLLESLDNGDETDVSPEWSEEIQRRVREMDEGRVRLIPHDEVMEEVRSRLNEIRRQKHAS